MPIDYTRELTFHLKRTADGFIIGARVGVCITDQWPQAQSWAREAFADTDGVWALDLTFLDVAAEFLYVQSGVVTNGVGSLAVDLDVVIDGSATPIQLRPPTAADVAALHLEVTSFTTLTLQVPTAASSGDVYVAVAGT